MSSNAPLLLAVESATATLSVALLRAREVVAERAGRPGAHHAEMLLPLVEAMLAEVGCEEPEIDAFGISIGPGSFTSLRIGLATVKGLAFATGRLAAAIPTLAALAWGYVEASRDRDPDEAIVALLDAHRGEVYAGVFTAPEGRDKSGAGALREVCTTGLLTPAELLERLPDRCVLVGEGAAVVAAAGLPLGPGVSLAAGAPRVPSASSIGTLAVQALERGEGCDPADLVPHYVRRAEAEVVRTALRVEEPG